MKKKKYTHTYDVETFLNKRKTKRTFVSVTFSGRYMEKAAFVMTLVAVLFWAVSSLPFKYFGQSLVYHSTPFFEGVPRQHSFDKDRLCLLAVSPLLDFDMPQKENAKTNQKTNPPEPLPEKQLYLSEVSVKNETDYTVDTSKILQDGYKHPANPKVLIVHTHGSESYTPSEKYSYEQTGNYRTGDTAYNMIRVGEEIANQLKKGGIDVIHDKSINDYPAYNDSYNKTEKVIQKHLKSDPDIAYVFDIHRDAVGENEKFVCDALGKKVAQIMIVCGTDTNLTNPLWRQNLSLAVHIQSYFNSRISDFFRPLNLRKERFNMHLTTGSLLFEVGASGNTLDEALESARILGEGLAKMLKQ